jgi:hypothetical protein
MRVNPLTWAIGGAAAIVAIALLVVLVMGETQRYGAHGAEHEAAPAVPPQREVSSGGFRLTVTLSPEEGKVGEVVTIQGRVTDAAGAPVRNVRFEVVSHHLEDDADVFRATFLSPDGTFTWGYPFWDGTEHEIRVTAAPGPDASAPFSPLTLRRVVAVEPVPPPIGVQLRAMFWLLLITAAGLAVGLPLGLRAPMRGRVAVRPRAAAA